MNKTIIGIFIVFSYFMQLMAQPCTQIWEEGKLAVDPKQRLEFLNAYIDSDCEDSLASAFTLRGDLMVAKRDFKLALNDYKSSIELTQEQVPTNTHALVLARNAMGGALLDLAQSESNEEVKTKLISRAVEVLQQAIRIDSFFDPAYLLLGNAYFYQKSYAESIEAFETCLKINPENAYAADNLLIVYRETGKYFGEQKLDIPTALAYLNKAYQLNKKDVETLRLLGVANGMNGANEEALNWFVQASKIDPGNAIIWWNLGTAYGNMGKKKAMKKCRKRAVEIDPEIEKKM